MNATKYVVAAIAGSIAVCLVAIGAVALSMPNGASADELKAEVLSDLSAEEIVSSDDIKIKYAKIGALGDSISAGYHLGLFVEDGKNVAASNNFVKYLNDMAGKLYKGPSIAENCRELGNCDELAQARLNPEMKILNYAVPGARVNSLLKATPNLDSPLFGVYELILGFPEGLNYVRGAESTYVARPAIAQLVDDEPTFTSLWIGNNDILYYATTGGLGAYTPIADFKVDMERIAAELAPLKTTVAIANIPNVSDIPHFKNSQQASEFLYNTQGIVIKSYEIEYIANIKSTDLITLSGFLPSYILDPKNPVSLYDLLYLYQQGKDVSALSLDGRFYLDVKEQLIVEDVVINYNNIIAGVASKYENFVLVDVNAFFEKIATNGYPFDINGDGKYDIVLKPEVGLFFDLDGVHPDPVGHALIANLYAEVLNARTSGADLPLMDVVSHAKNFGGVNNIYNLIFGKPDAPVPPASAPGQVNKLINTLGKAYH